MRTEKGKGSRAHNIEKTVEKEIRKNHKRREKEERGFFARLRKADSQAVRIEVEETVQNGEAQEAMQ